MFFFFKRTFSTSFYSLRKKTKPIVFNRNNIRSVCDFFPKVATSEKATDIALKTALAICRNREYNNVKESPVAHTPGLRKIQWSCIPGN